jgi:hypothetical protein
METDDDHPAPTRLADAFMGLPARPMTDILGLSPDSIRSVFTASGEGKTALEMVAAGRMPEGALAMLARSSYRPHDDRELQRAVLAAQARSPAARTADATREMADRLAIAQADLAKLREDAAADRQTTESALRIARWSLVAAALGVAAGFAAVLAPLY